MGSDKRQHHRVSDPTVVVKIASIHKLKSFYLSDLSTGGVFVKCEKPLPLNSELDIKLVAPGLAEPLILHGRVARIEKSAEGRKKIQTGMGVRFERLTASAKERLASLVAEHSRPDSEREATLEPSRKEIAGLIRELKAAQEEVAERDRNLEIARDELRAVKAELDDERERAVKTATIISSLRAEIAQLRDRQRDARKVVSTFTAQLQQVFGAEPEEREDTRRGQVSAGLFDDAGDEGVRFVDDERKDASRPPAPPPDAIDYGNGPDEDELERRLAQARSGSAEKRVSPWDFGRLLRQGARIVLTDRFHEFKPSSEAEGKLASWLRQSETFPAVVGLSRGSIAKETLAMFCFEFYEKGLIDLQYDEDHGA